MVELETDVVIVGAGLAGSFAARTATERGLTCIILDIGTRAVPDHNPPSLVARVRAKLRGQVQHPDPDRWPDPFWLDGGGEVRAFLGMGPGGSSTVYGAALERFRRIDFDSVPRPLAAPDQTQKPIGWGWPLDFDGFVPWYDRAEDQLGVVGARDPLDRDLLKPLLKGPGIAPRDAVIAERLVQNGLHPYRIPVGMSFLPGCSECLGHRCQRECKADGYSRAFKVALETGRATFLETCRVDRVIPERDGAVVVARQGPENTPVRVSARACIMAAGALNTPLILARSKELWAGVGEHPLLGRGLMFHAGDVFAVIDPTGAPTFGPRKTIALRDFYELDGMVHAEVQSLGMDLDPAKITFYLRVQAEALGLGRLGPALEALRLPAVLASRFLKNSVLLATIQQDLPYFENRVYEGDRDSRSGTGSITVRYKSAPELIARASRLRGEIRKGFAPNRVIFLSPKGLPCWGHPMGTCRMARTPDEGVVDAGGALWDHPAIRVADASCMPSSGGTNPSLTVVANAMRIADSVADTLSVPEKARVMETAT